MDTGRKTVGCPQENSSTVNSTGTGVYHGIVAVRHLEGDVGHLEDVRPPVGVRFQHVADQLRQRLRVALLLVGRYVELAALHTHTHTFQGSKRNHQHSGPRTEEANLDGQRRLAKGQREEAQLVEEAAQRPNVRFGRDRLAHVQVHHLRRPGPIHHTRQYTSCPSQASCVPPD